MKKTILFALLASSTATLAFAGCSSSSNNTSPGDASTSDVTMTGDDGGTDSAMMGNDSATTGDSPSEAASPPPAPPALGAQIDRMGRPAINTALIHVFDPACAAPGLCAAKDMYNADPSPADWNSPDGGDFVAQIYGNLAIFDGLDTNCGNQAGFGALSTPGYGVLATVLSQDALWVDTTRTTCNQYLAVELNALGVVNTDCGGRSLTENTIDTTYNLLAGTFTVDDAGIVGGGVVTNGITAPSKAPSTTFPYFASPH